MKYWLSHLPLEVWVDVYSHPWISRRKLGRIVHRFKNRKYVEYLQFYLHDWGKRKLKELRFDENGLSTYVDSPYRLYMDFPLTPKPINIKSFERISIEHFDARTIQFLHQIGRLLTNLKMRISDISRSQIENLRTILANLVPLLNGIDSMEFDMLALPTMKQFFGDKLTKLKELRIVDFEGETLDEAIRQTTAQFVMDWLHASEQDGNGPKLGEAQIYNGNGFSTQILTAIREQFYAATDPCTFALTLWLYPQREFDDFHLNNGIGEELHGVQIGDPWNRRIKITRHKANRDKEMKDWVKGIEAKRYSGRPNQIDIYNPTIGSLDAMDASENEEADQQQASTSKKA